MVIDLFAVAQPVVVGVGVQGVGAQRLFLGIGEAVSVFVEAEGIGEHVAQIGCTREVVGTGDVGCHRGGSGCVGCQCHPEVGLIVGDAG